MRPLHFLMIGLAIGCSSASSMTAKFPRSAAEGHLGPNWLRDDLQVAAQLGATSGRELTSGAGIAGDNFGISYSPRAGNCAVVLARGSQTVADLDLFVYGDDGSWHGSDEQREKDATVVLCPPYPARVYISARIASGYGRVSLGVADVPPAKAQSVRAAFSARPH